MPVSLGETTITRATCGSRIRAIAHALPVTSNATQSRGVQALREQLQRLGPRLDPARRPQPALLDDRHLAEIAMDIQRYRSHRLLLAVDRRRGRTGGQTTSTDPRSQRNQASRRGGHRKARAQSPSRKTACPTCVLPEGPCPSRPNLSRRPDDTGAFTEQFHAARSRSAARRVGARACVGTCSRVSDDDADDSDMRLARDAAAVSRCYCRADAAERRPSFAAAVAGARRKPYGSSDS